MSHLIDSVVANSGGIDYVTLSNKTTIYCFFSNSALDTLYVYKSTDSGINWSQVTTVSAVTRHGTSPGYAFARAALDGNGYIHVLSSCTTPTTRDVAYCLFNTSNDTFGTWEQAFNYSGAYGYTECGIAIDSNSKPHILVCDYVSSMGNGYTQIKYTNKTGSSWLTPETVSTSATTAYRMPCIIVRNSNYVEAIYQTTMTTSASLYRTRTTSWGTETQITTGSPWNTTRSITAKTDGTVYRYIGGHFGLLYENGTSFGITWCDNPSALLFGSTRYAFYYSQQTGYYGFYYVTNSGSGWSSAVPLEQGNFSNPYLTTSWAYNFNYQTDYVDYIYIDTSGYPRYNKVRPKPTTALNTPADNGTVDSGTPTLNFTGTEVDGYDVEYEVQLDTVNSFDSQSQGYGTINYENKEFHPTEGSAKSVVWKSDGTRMYVCFGTTTVRQYTVSAAFDISSTITLEKTYTADINVYHMWIRSNGLMLFIGDASNTLERIDMTSAWDISTGSKAKTKSAGNAGGFALSTDGLEFYIAYNGPKVSQWHLSTAWDIESTWEVHGSYDYAHGYTINGLAIGNDGIHVWLTEVTYIWKLRLSTAWDITTYAEDGSPSFSQDTRFQGACIHPNGTKFWWCGYNTGHIYSYTCVTGVTYPLLDKLSETDAGFTVSGETHPFSSGVACDFTVQEEDALTEEMYYWRARCQSPDGTGIWGDWTTARHFHITESVSITPTPASFKMNTFIGSVPIPPAPATFKMSAFFTPQRGAFGWASLYRDLNSILFVTPQPASFKTEKVSPSVVLGSVSVTPGVVDFGMVKVDPNVDIFMPSITLDLSSSPNEFSLLTVDPTVVIEEAQVYFGVLKVWTGSQWMPKPMMVYKGGLWVNAVLKRWEDEWLLVDTGA